MKEVIDSQKLLDILIDAKIVPANCTSFSLQAKVGSLIRLEYTVLAGQGVFSIPWKDLALDTANVEVTC